MKGSTYSKQKHNVARQTYSIHVANRQQAMAENTVESKLCRCVHIFSSKTRHPKAFTPLSPTYTLSLVSHLLPSFSQPAVQINNKALKWRTEASPMRPGVRALLITLQNTALASSAFLPSLPLFCSLLLLFPSLCTTPRLVSLLNF